MRHVFLLATLRYVCLQRSLKNQGENVRLSLPAISGPWIFVWVTIRTWQSQKMPIFFLDCWVFQICCSYSFDRLSPFEWENPTPWVESDEVENCCTLHNCFWHNWGSLMQQGSDICPRYFCATKKINQTKTVCQITLCHFFSKNIRISFFD